MPQPAMHPIAALLRAAVLAVALPAMAQTAPPALAVDEAALRAFVEQHVASAAGAQVTRLDVQVGHTERRAALAPCQRTEPFMPTTRAWGRLSVGLRCVEGAHWTIMLPVTVRAWGLALVAAAPLPAGTVLRAQDLREQEVELTRELPGLARDAAQLKGRTLVRAVNEGQPLRANMARTTAVVQAGDPVRLRLLGAGFAITAGGQALGPAGEGQSLRVRTDQGKIVTGVAHQGRIVDVVL